jgi:hypothetical protein
MRCALTVNLHGEAGGSVAWLQIGEMLDSQFLIRQNRGIKLCVSCVSCVVCRVCDH